MPKQKNICQKIWLGLHPGSNRGPLTICIIISFLLERGNKWLFPKQVSYHWTMKARFESQGTAKYKYIIETLLFGRLSQNLAPTSPFVLSSSSVGLFFRRLQSCYETQWVYWCAHCQVVRSWVICVNFFQDGIGCHTPKQISQECALSWSSYTVASVKMSQKAAVQSDGKCLCTTSSIQLHMYLAKANRVCSGPIYVLADTTTTPYHIQMFAHRTTSCRRYTFFWRDSIPLYTLFNNINRCIGIVAESDKGLFPNLSLGF